LRVTGSIRDITTMKEVELQLQLLAQNITESTDVVIQITNCSSQQLRGVEQVTIALESIRNASRQNLDGIQQIERAVQDLQQLGQTLTHLLRV
jgi:methyl-accepting chemotaxis protein